MVCEALNCNRPAYQYDFLFGPKYLCPGHAVNKVERPKDPQTGRELSRPEVNNILEDIELGTNYLPEFIDYVREKLKKPAHSLWKNYKNTFSEFRRAVDDEDLLSMILAVGDLFAQESRMFHHLQSVVDSCLLEAGKWVEPNDHSDPIYDLVDEMCNTKTMPYGQKAVDYLKNILTSLQVSLELHRAGYPEARKWRENPGDEEM